MPASTAPLPGSRERNAVAEPAGGDRRPSAANEDAPRQRRRSRGYGAPIASPAGTQVGWGTILIDRFLGDRMLVYVFRAMLAAAIVVLSLDLREMWRTPIPDFDTLIPGTLDFPTSAPRTSTPAPNPPRSTPVTLGEAMRIELASGGTLRLQGTIDPGVAERLAAELDARGEYVTLVELESPGGSVGDALAMSAMLRDRELAVRVPSGAICASSCPIVLAGGAVREVARDANVGVHQIFTQGGPVIGADRAMASAQETTARIARHLDAMGIEPALWFHALETPKDELYYLTPDEMMDYALATVLLDAAPSKTD